MTDTVIFPLFILCCGAAELIGNKCPFLKLVMQGPEEGGCLLGPCPSTHRFCLLTLHYATVAVKPVASGAERVRDTEQRQRETERNEEEKRQGQSQKAKTGESAWKCSEILAIFNLIYANANFQRAAAEYRATLLAHVHHGSAVCACLWKQAITPTSLRTSSENRSQSLVFVWKLRRHICGNS